MSADGDKDTQAFLESTIAGTRTRFEARRTLLSFRQYLDVVREQPVLQARDAATYLRDCFLYYGTEKVERPYGRFTRYRLFDCPFDDGRDALIGQESVQEAVFGFLSDFVRDGRVSKLILLHGPNGSAKSSFIACIARALEHYSLESDGALYSFNWVFPARKIERGSIGFGGGRSAENLESYAHLGSGEIDAVIRNELRDHPLLLLPRASRLEFLRGLLTKDAPLPDALTEGELSPRSRAIFSALLKANQGDLGEVLRHVQVERIDLSRRYRCGLSTIDPQMRVDAGVRQVSADRSLGSLPPSLQNLTLYEAVGDLVDANRGMVEFNDLLKRPLEAFKYILSTCEKGTVGLETMTLQLDTVFIGSSNDGHVDAFMAMTDFASFKARIEFVLVPYLLDYEQERNIYASLVQAHAARRPVAPHAATVAALWAVMTRLGRPAPDLYPVSLRKAMGSMTPLEKAELYARGRVPNGVPRDVANELRNFIPKVFRERDAAKPYEGRLGASPREIKGALLGAARRESHRCLTPLALLDELRDIVRQTQVYEWLRVDPDGEFHNPESFIDVVQDWYLDLVEEELHRAMGLIDVARTVDLFRRYIENVTQVVRKEKRHNPVTGKYEDPDEGLMGDVERRLGIGALQAADARAGLLQRVAAWRMDNPTAAFDLTEIFAEAHNRLTESFYEEKRQSADRLKRKLLAYLVDDRASLDADDIAQAEATISRLELNFGYDRACAIEVIASLLRLRNQKA